MSVGSSDWRSARWVAEARAILGAPLQRLERRPGDNRLNRALHARVKFK